jgi:hypothetical protein
MFTSLLADDCLTTNNNGGSASHASSCTNNTALDKSIQELRMSLYMGSDGSGLSQGIIHVFSWRDWKQQKLSVDVTSNKVDIRTGYLRNSFSKLAVEQPHRLLFLIDFRLFNDTVNTAKVIWCVIKWKMFIKQE